MPEIRLTLPYPPALNHLYATVRGRRVLSARGRQFKADAGKTAIEARARPCSGAVGVSLRFFRPRRIGDIDGMLKAMLDGLTGQLWQDDRQIIELHAYRFDDPANPRAEVHVWEIPLV